jgi:phosphoribosylanthranilate isomerase
MTRIKICGITREEDALCAAGLGADFLGFVFAPESPRHIDPARAAGIIATVRSLQKGRGGTATLPTFVGVFRDSDSAYVEDVAREAGLDMVQLHGEETEEDIQTLGVPVIKARRVGQTLPDTTAHPSASWLLFDTFDSRRAGGTGRRFDWSLLALYDRSKPFFLSGGLSPENVAAAVSLVRPDAIDLSSGVESAPGIKDPEKLERLFERVRRA